MTGNAAPLVCVAGLKVCYPGGRRGLFGPRQSVRAVDGVSFEIARGETFGVVGESGCGKSSLGRALLLLPPPTNGTIVFDGTDITRLQEAEFTPVRKRIQMVFQDSYASLNPRMTVAENIAEPLAVHSMPAAEQRARVSELLDLVGLPGNAAKRYPHEFSGGQRQRINIARALALRPEFLICDEPVSAVDVSIQAQIINLLQDLQDALGLTLLFISHDLAVVRHLCHRIAVMYLGEIIETGSREALFSTPRHPYTQALLSAVPVPRPPDPSMPQRVLLSGEVPSPVNPPPGCRFASRCFMRETVRARHGIECARVAPQLVATSTNQSVACHLYDAGRP